MDEIIITCEECDTPYFGTEYDSKTKKVKGKVLRTVTYTAHCTHCDKPVFEEKMYQD